jgi:hypothetical protein
MWLALSLCGSNTRFLYLWPQEAQDAQGRTFQFQSFSFQPFPLFRLAPAKRGLDGRFSVFWDGVSARETPVKGGEFRSTGDRKRCQVSVAGLRRCVNPGRKMCGAAVVSHESDFSDAGAKTPDHPPGKIDIGNIAGRHRYADKADLAP